MFKLINNLRRNISANVRENPRIFRLFFVLRALIILALVRAILLANYDSAFVCLMSLVLFMIPSLMENGFKIKFSPIMEGSIYLFIYAAEILGEVNHFYVALPGWDTILHTINGFLAAAVGFSMIELLNKRSRNLYLSPFYLAFMAFCFSMTVGVLWEFFEFGADYFLGKDMQKDFIISSIGSVTLDPDNTQKVIHVRDITQTVIHTASGETVIIPGGYLDIGIIDTMKDLFVNFIGAVVYSTIGYFSLKRNNTHSPSIAVYRSDDGDNLDDYNLAHDDGFEVDGDEFPSIYPPK